eukprot:36193-Eustigmatos_ZCMA.PRE.1
MDFEKKTARLVRRDTFDKVCRSSIHPRCFVCPMSIVDAEYISTHVNDLSARTGHRLSHCVTVQVDVEASN